MLGSTTESMKETAAAASKALPPARNMTCPASVASGWALAIMPSADVSDFICDESPETWPRHMKMNISFRIYNFKSFG
jgi:hypothetical protein